MYARHAETIKSARALLDLVFKRFAEERCVQVAGDLTFTTLLALVPLFTIAFALFAAFPVFHDWSNAFKVFLLTTLVPEIGGKVITVYMQQFADNAARLTAIGIVFLAITALALMMTIERVFNTIWRVPRPRPVVQRLVLYWAALTIGPLLIGASLSLTSWLVTRSMSIAAEVSGLDAALLKLAPVVLNVAAFALLYLAVPNRKVALRDALIGGVASALAFELMKRGFALYVQLFPTYALIYGAFASIPIFLLWIYLSWIVTLFGAVIAAVLPVWRSGIAERLDAPGASLFRALLLFDALRRGAMHADTPGTAKLAAASGVTEEQAERLLEPMQQRGWVRRVEQGGWILGRDLVSLRLVDLYEEFVLRLPQGASQEVLPLPRVAPVLAKLQHMLDIPLRDLLEQPPNPHCARDQSAHQSSSAPAAADPP
jgi:membrane protein